MASSTTTDMDTSTSTPVSSTVAASSTTSTDDNAVSSSSVPSTAADSFCPVCNKPARLSCPTCIELKLKPTRFCSQECFKAVKDRLAFRPPHFDYTGPLRPAYVTPQRRVADHIQKPDYHITGEPLNERSTTIHLNNAKEIAGIRAACKIGREALDLAARSVRVGITTDEIDTIIHEFIIAQNAYPSPLNYKFFPKSCCTSVNEVICHGIPDVRPLENGDIVNVDISVYKDGFHADLNETFCVGEVEQKYKDLIKVTHDALMKSIELVKPGTFFRDFGEVITKVTGKANYSVVRSYCGHGIGAQFHPPPSIPHYARNKAVGQCKPGMVFTIEPMVNMGTWKDILWPDDWTVATTDGKRSAQFEHTILVTEKGYEILTARTKDSPPLWWESASSSSSSSDAAPVAASAK